MGQTLPITFHAFVRIGDEGVRRTNKVLCRFGGNRKHTNRETQGMKQAKCEPTEGSNKQDILAPC